MTVALVIGFGPFPGAPHNPSADLVRRLGRRRRPALADVRIAATVLPTSYAAVNEELPALLQQHDPDLVLFFGFATRAPFLRIERRAVNAATGLHADAARRKPAARAFLPAMPPELHVHAPVERLAFAARATRIDTRLSRDAGRYICNAALYRALLAGKQESRPQVAAFVHIPRPRPRARLDAKRSHMRPTMNALVRAGEAVLVAFVAEVRRG